MKNYFKISSIILLVLIVFSCKDETKSENKKNIVKQELSKTAATILGNPDYLAMSYGGYRQVDHDIEPTVAELKGRHENLERHGGGNTPYLQSSSTSCC